MPLQGELPALSAGEGGGAWLYLSRSEEMEPSAAWKNVDIIFLVLFVDQRCTILQDGVSKQGQFSLIHSDHDGADDTTSGTYTLLWRTLYLLRKFDAVLAVSWSPQRSDGP